MSRKCYNPRLFLNPRTCSRVLPGNCSRTWSIEIFPFASFARYLLRTLISLAVNFVTDLILMILSLSSIRVPLQSVICLSCLKNFLCNLQTFPFSNLVLVTSKPNLVLKSLIILKSLTSSCFDHLHFSLLPSLFNVLFADEKSLDLL